MRIAILTEGYLPELSGVTTSLFQRLRWLSAWGHEVRVYAPDYSALAAMYPRYREHSGVVMPGVTVCSYPSRPYYVDFARDPKPFTFGQVEKDLLTFCPEVIHAECPERLFLGFLCRAGVRLARRMCVPATAFYHTNYLDFIGDYREQVAWLRIPGVVRALRRLLVWVYNSYDVTMVSSEVVRNRLAQYGVRNTVLRGFLGVDTERFRPPGEGPTRQPRSAITVLYLGRLSPDKEIGLLLRAFDALRERMPEVRFIVVGAGPEEARAREWAAQHGDATVVGRVSNEEAVTYYREADIFATACSKESFGLTVLEAMACGTAVVGPDSGGVAETIRHGETGLVFQPGDARSFAEALLRLAGDPGLRAKLGAAGLVMAQDRSWANGACAMITLWNELIARAEWRPVLSAPA